MDQFRFSKSLWKKGKKEKNQYPLHVIDGCLAAEESEKQRTPVYFRKIILLNLCLTVTFLDLFLLFLLLDATQLTYPLV